MKKYYKVYLNENLTYDVCSVSEYAVICEHNAVTQFFHDELVFKEIVTGKLIYPSTYEIRKNLTYELLSYELFIDKDSKPRCFRMTQEEVKEWLESMDEKSLKNYVDDKTNLENKAIKAYEEEQQKYQKIMVQEKQAAKAIKKTLHQIKNK